MKGYERVYRGCHVVVVLGDEGITVMMMQSICTGAMQKNGQSGMGRRIADGEDDVMDEASVGSSSVCLTFS